MLFNSIQFLLFFPVVTILFFMLPHKYRWMLLLAASCYFYMAFIPVYILILAVTILIDYFAGILIAGSGGLRKKLYLVISIVSTCAVLFVFKYFNFFNSNIIALAKLLHWNYPVEVLNIILPIGLSFHTFQSLSYVIEVYRGRQEVERDFGIYALYVMFYPQLVAGPIERPQNLLHQFREEHKFDYQNMTDGLKLMAWGMFKKVVVADSIAFFVNPVYADPAKYSGPELVIATVLFAFQIYSDFSGYSDIAIGAAQTMGFRLMDNFNRPYFSGSVGEFWKKWHISLSSWFRDYLYVGLGGNRSGALRTYLNIVIVFAISGLWHGANWTFIIWGILNGIIIVLERILHRPVQQVLGKLGILPANKALRIVSVLLTFSFICLGWVFFRAKNLDDALFILSHMPLGWNEIADVIVKGSSIFIKEKFVFTVCISSILLMEIIHVIQKHNSIRHMLSGKHWALRWSSYFALILMIILFGQFGTPSQFIYFQF